MVRRWLNVCRWGLVALIGLWGGGFARPVAQGQAPERLFLPVLLRDRPVIRGQLIDVQTLASMPNLLLMNVNPVLLPPPVMTYEPWISEDAGVHWRQPARAPWLDEIHLPTYAHLETALLESAAGPLLVTMMTAIADPQSGLSTVVYTSADLGQTWARYPLTTDQGCTAMDDFSTATTPAAPERLYSQGVCRHGTDPLTLGRYVLIASDDAGMHWRTVPMAVSAQTGSYVSPARAGWLFIFGPEGRLWRTVNEGQLWEKVGAPPTGAFSLSPSDPERLVSASGLGAFISQDSGLSWKALRNLPCDLTLGNWEVPGATPLLLFTCTDLRLVLTRDDGQSWETLPPLPWSAAHSLNVFADRAVPERLWVFAAGALTDSVWSIDLSTSPTWTRVLETDPLQ